MDTYLDCCPWENAFDFHSFPTLPDLFVSFPAFSCIFRTLVFVLSEMSPFFYPFNLLTDHNQMLNRIYCQKNIGLYQIGSMSEHQYNQLLQADVDVWIINGQIDA